MLDDLKGYVEHGQARRGLLMFRKLARRPVRQVHRFRGGTGPLYAGPGFASKHIVLVPATGSRHQQGKSPPQPNGWRSLTSPGDFSENGTERDPSPR